jgi:alginate O-acetyltransferase complex protein AlgJ
LFHDTILPALAKPARSKALPNNVNLMNLTTLRLRYSQFFIICLLGFALFTATQSLAGGVSKFQNSLWGHQALVTIFTSLRLNLGDRVYLQTLVGKDGWVFLGWDLSGYENFDKPGLNGLRRTQQRLQTLYEELQKRNITLILVIAPNKTTIYPDKLPDEIHVFSTQSRLDTFSAYLRQHGPPILVDLRPALIQGREKQDVYYKTDTHWNAYGAFIGYTQIMQELSKTYPQLAPKSIDDFEITSSKPISHDLARIMGAGCLLEPKIKFRLKKNSANPASTAPGIPITPKENLPKLLMYMDSFGVGLGAFIPHHFSQATLLENQSPNYWKNMSLNSIDTIKPNIVIVELVERSFNGGRLVNILNNFLAGLK